MATVKTDLERRLYLALRRIATLYDSPESLRRRCRSDYGLPPEEAIEMAYENIQADAKSAIRGVRLPKEKSYRPIVTAGMSENGIG